MNRYCFCALIAIAIAAILFGCSQPKQEDEQDTATSLNEKISVKTVEGEASGFDCAVVDVLCPSTHRAADFTTGIFTAEKKFYFIVNIPQSFMTQYFLEKMSVTGKVYHPYDDALEPEQIYLLKNGEKKLVYDAGYFYDPQGHKAMFNQGRVVDGVWVCDQCAGTK
jgi:hypothetical protein